MAYLRPSLHTDFANALREVLGLEPLLGEPRRADVAERFAIDEREWPFDEIHYAGKRHRGCP